MTVFNVKTDHTNKDLLQGEELWRARDRYLELYDSVKIDTHLPDPVVEEYGDKFILRADLAPAGLKSYGAEKLVATTESDTLVYVAPRVGHAPHAIATLANMYGKRCVFFCPASKHISKHQGALLSQPNVELRFIRIAAMPVLNKYAREWAEKNGAAFLPFGLTNTPLVTAGIVDLTRRVSDVIGCQPSETFCAVSTGTMIRALQIGWPSADHYGIAVARNMHDGEVGDAHMTSYHRPFTSPVSQCEAPPFPSTATYDAKAWVHFDMFGRRNSIFINVGSDDVIEKDYDALDAFLVNSDRDWGDLRDLA